MVYLFPLRPAGHTRLPFSLRFLFFFFLINFLLRPLILFGFWIIISSLFFRSVVRFRCCFGDHHKYSVEKNLVSLSNIFIFVKGKHHLNVLLFITYKLYPLCTWLDQIFFSLSLFPSSLCFLLFVFNAV